jgi:hypothetical protein
MSQENVELVRSILAAWERGDYSSAEWADTEIEFKLADGPAPGNWQGLTGMAAGWRSVLTAWDQMRQIPDEVRDVDAERVLSLHHYRSWKEERTRPWRYAGRGSGHLPHLQRQGDSDRPLLRPQRSPPSRWPPGGIDRWPSANTPTRPLKATPARASCHPRRSH